MGKVQCNSVNRNLEIVALIERKLAEKDTPLDKRLHQEYLNILNEGKDTQETVKSLNFSNYILALIIIYKLREKRRFLALKNGTEWPSPEREIKSNQTWRIRL